MTPPFSLLADVGGTNTRVAFAQGAHVLPDTMQRFRNDDFASLYDVLDRFDTSSVDAICLDWAGPVANGEARLTNRDWQVSQSVLTSRYDLKKSFIINDMQAQGYALDQLETDAVTHICGPVPPANGTRMVINIGTGFNASPIFQIAGQSFVPMNEAGHIGLAQSDPWDADLRHAMIGDDTFLAVEDALSGRGLLALVRALSPDFTGPADQIFPTFQNDPHLVEAGLREFAKILGEVAGDLALTHLPTGGIYLVGGVATGIAPLLDGLGFHEAFCAKGRFTDFQAQFPVLSNDDPMATLKGCAVALRTTFSETNL